ncbi:MAG: VOC family protein, partial [Planctomycetes bacterium]|nr:VOC family protein [Planctomycetota bacterium]
MKVKQLDHLNLSVINFEQSAEWYKRVLGFEIVEQGIQDGQPWGVIKNGDAMLCIYQHPEW